MPERSGLVDKLKPSHINKPFRAEEFRRRRPGHC
jgi:hypothetical protein